jgi:hypothetical protein
MPRACTICTHPQRTAMERDLADAIPLRTIADRWSVSKTALIRHKADHLPERPTPPSPAISQPVFPVAGDDTSPRSAASDRSSCRPFHRDDHYTPHRVGRRPLP